MLVSPDNSTLCFLNKIVSRNSNFIRNWKKILMLKRILMVCVCVREREREREKERERERERGGEGGGKERDRD